MSEANRHIHFKVSSESLAICAYEAQDGFLLFNASVSFAFETDIVSLLTHDDAFDLLMEKLQKMDLNFSNYHSMDIAFPANFALLKTVKIDSAVDASFELSQVEWEFSQLTKRPLSDFSILLPTEYSQKNERIFLALFKKLHHFSEQLSSRLQLELDSLSLSLLNYFTYLKENNSLDKNSKAILLFIDETSVDIGLYYDGILQSLDTIENSKKQSIDSLQIELRNYLDVYLSKKNEFSFEKICLAGINVDHEAASRLSNFLQIAIELSKGDEIFNFDASISDEEQRLAKTVMLSLPPAKRVSL